MKKVDNLSDAVKKFEEEQGMVSLKKKGQLLGFWSSLPYKPADTQCQGQAELGLISTADGRVFQRLPNNLYCHQFRIIYKVGLGLYFASKKICFSSTGKYIERIKVTLQEPQSIDQLVVPHRTVIRLRNEVLVITGDPPDGEAADWENIEDIAMSNTKTFHLIVFKVVPIYRSL